MTERGFQQRDAARNASSARFDLGIRAGPSDLEKSPDPPPSPFWSPMLGRSAVAASQAVYSLWRELALEGIRPIVANQLDLKHVLPQ